MSINSGYIVLPNVTKSAKILRKDSGSDQNIKQLSSVGMKYRIIKMEVDYN